MAADLQILITAKDQASNVLKGVKRELSGMDDAAGRAGGGMGRLGGILKGGLVVGAGVAAVGIGALAAVIGSSVQAATEAEDIQAQLNAALKSTGGIAGVTADAINAQALALSKVTKFEDDSIVAASSLLLTFTKVGKDVFPQATEATLNMAQAMGMDLKSATMLVGKALNDPLKGMTALTRAGIQFTDAQKDQIKAMVEAGDAAGAQRIILAELETQFGGSAEAAGKTLTGQLEILKNQIGNVKENIGNVFIPILTDLATKLGPMLIEAAKGLADFIVNGLVPAIQSAAQWFSTNLLPALQAVGGFIQGNVVPVLQAVWTWLATNLPPAIQALAAFWENVLQPALKVVWQFIQDKIVPILKVVIEVWFKALKLELQLLAAFWENILLPAIKKVWEFLQTYIIPIITILVDVAILTLQGALQVLSDLWDKTLLPAITAVWQFIQEHVLPIFQSVIDKINGPLNDAFAFIQGVIGGVRDAFQWLGDKALWVIGLIQDLIDKIKGVPSIPGIPNAGRAMGGPVRAGSSYIVGERGPELFVPSRAGVIIPHGGGRSVSIVITGNTFGNRGDVDYLLGQLDRRLRLEGGILPV